MRSTIEELINRDLNRRDFLKRVAIVAGGVAVAGPVSQILAACGTDDSDGAGGDQQRLSGTVKVLAWGDKLNDDVNDGFNRTTGGSAQFTIFTENPEALAKIRQNKEAFDTVFIDGLWANTHWNAGTIVPIPFKDWDIYDEYFTEFADLSDWQVPGGQMADPARLVRRRDRLQQQVCNPPGQPCRTARSEVGRQGGDLRLLLPEHAQLCSRRHRPEGHRHACGKDPR